MTRFWSACGLPPLWIRRSSRKKASNNSAALIIALGISLLTACSANKNKGYTASPPTALNQRQIKITVATNDLATAQNQNQYNPQTQTPTPTPVSLPRARILPLTARIASVNEKLRFVVVDFTNSRQPQLDERLSVYRVGEKVAEIKISGPYRNTTVAADIMAGEVKYGDEVKTE
jgi:hypothetical protein